MNFFQSLSDLNVTGDWKIAIAKSSPQTWIVSVLLDDKACGDQARHLIPPILLEGTPQELDEGFFAHLTEPVKRTAALLTNMEQYLKQVEQATLQSRMEKDRAARAEKEKTEKQKNYDEGMNKAAELEAAGKHREAWMKVPDPSDYPEKAEELKARKSELARLFAPDLFNT